MYWYCFIYLWLSRFVFFLPFPSLSFLFSFLFFKPTTPHIYQKKSGDKGKKAIENVQQVASDCPLDGRETNLSHTNSATASPLPPSPSPSPFSSFFLPSFLSPTILYGIFLSLVSLSLSSFKSNYQEYIFSRYHLPPTETIFYSHLYGALLLLPLLLLSGEFLEVFLTHFKFLSTYSL